MTAASTPKDAPYEVYFEHTERDATDRLVVMREAFLDAEERPRRFETIKGAVLAWEETMRERGLRPLQFDAKSPSFFYDVESGPPTYGRRSYHVRVRRARG